MNVKIYGDDGYVEHDISFIEGEIEIGYLVEILHEKQILSDADMNRLLPGDFEIA